MSSRLQRRNEEIIARKEAEIKETVRQAWRRPLGAGLNVPSYLSPIQEGEVILQCVDRSDITDLIE